MSGSGLIVGRWILLAGVVWVVGGATAQSPPDPDAPPPRRHAAAVEDPAAAMRAELAQPFCYFTVPSDVLGFKDCPEGTQLTGDGALHTGFGELDILIGDPPENVNQRVRTMDQGYLPIYTYAQTIVGVRYEICAFGAPLDLDPRQDLINFVRVTVRNTADAKRIATAGVRFGPARRDRSRSDQVECVEWWRDRFLKPDVWGDGVAKAPIELRDDGTAWCREHLLFTWPADKDAAPPHPDDRSIAGQRFELAPGESRSFDFKLPYVPVHAAHADTLKAIAAAKFDDYRTRVARFWDELLGRGLVIELAEDKVVNTLRASLIYNLIARDITADGKFVQKVNEFGYDRFYIRDTSFIARAYDVMGHPQIASETLEAFLVKDDQGRLALVHDSPDDWGQTTWAVCAHARFTGDLEFAKRAYPAIPVQVAKLEEFLKDEPAGLWPVSRRYDNEMVNGHHTGHNLWVVLGLREAADLARRVGATDDAARFQKLHDDFRTNLLKRIDTLCQRTQGYIPPCLDDPMEGFDWETAGAAVYPFTLLPPHDDRVTATIRMVRENKLQEGVLTWGANAWAIRTRKQQGIKAETGWMHHYMTFNLLDAEVCRGEQRHALEDFYSILAHTGSTHTGFEHEIWQWGNRDPGTNYPPHGWFAARTGGTVRNMLVREDAPDLRLCALLSPVWIEAGREIRVRNAPTEFGTISYTAKAAEDGLAVEIESQWRQPPRKLVLHVPWFVDVSAATADDKPATVQNGVVELAPATRNVKLAWRWRERPQLSYAQAVKNYLEMYYLRPTGLDYHYLFNAPRPPRIANRSPVFVDQVEVALQPPINGGTPYYTLDGSDPTPASTKYTAPIRLNQTTTVKAITVWDDGQFSVPVQETFTKTALRPAEKVAGLTPGLSYEYYEDGWVHMPDFDTLKVLRTGTATNFDVAALKQRKQEYGLRFRGYIDAPQDGVYTFHLVSDDGGRLFIGKDLVIDNDGEHGRLEAAGSIALQKGHHPLTLLYFNLYGDDMLSLTFKVDGGPPQPAVAHLFTGSAAAGR